MIALATFTGRRAAQGPSFATPILISLAHGTSSYREIVSAGAAQGQNPGEQVFENATLAI
jgi:hypothetical protein